MVETAHIGQPPDSFCKHRLALSPLDTKWLGAAALNGISRQQDIQLEKFADFLDWHKLTPLWQYFLESSGQTSRVDAAFGARLKSARFRNAATYVLQRAALSEVDALLQSRGIAYAAMKGAHIREVAYPDPSLRPASDIDILVSRIDREACIRTLIEAGYAVNAGTQNLSHEVTVTKGEVDLDVHWDVLRPGRMRRDIVGPMLERRERTGGVWGLAPSDAAFLMLVHPAFTKYVTSPNMALISVADFILWTGKFQIDWDLVAQRLYDQGVKTAAWAVLTWFLMIAPPGSIDVPAGFLEQIKPGPLRARYLQRWLDRDLATRWLKTPMPIQLGLTLPLHDRPHDALRALQSSMKSMMSRKDQSLQLAILQP